MLDGDRKRILIVDDHPLVRDGLAHWISLQHDLDVCCAVATDQEALAFLRHAPADLAIIDLCLQSRNGLELIKQIRAAFPAVKLLVLSTFPESLYAERCHRAGALGYINQRESNETLMGAIRTVLAGERYLSPELSKRLVGVALRRRDRKESPLERLSDRELGILRMIGEGLGTGAIANQLFLSPHTIDTHRENLKRKLGLRGGPELTRFAVRWLLEAV